jgi:tRNA(Arg) A34 adenosine deaminase TadA
LRPEIDSLRRPTTRWKINKIKAGNQEKSRPRYNDARTRPRDEFQYRICELVRDNRFLRDLVRWRILVSYFAGSKTELLNMNDAERKNDAFAAAAGEHRLLPRRLIVGGFTIVYPFFWPRAAFPQQHSTVAVEGDEAERWMARAEELKRLAVNAGDQPYGAVVVKDGRIVGEAPSRVVTNHDPTAHAEIEAIRDACRRLGSGDLSGCILYGTSRPCRMCETAAYWARIARFVHGPGRVEGGRPSYSSC